MCVSVGSRGISLTCVLTPCRVIGVCVVLMTLGAIGAAVWAVGQTTHQYTPGHYLPEYNALLNKPPPPIFFVVSYCTMEEDTGLYNGECITVMHCYCSFVFPLTTVELLLSWSCGNKKASGLWAQENKRKAFHDQINSVLCSICFSEISSNRFHWAEDIYPHFVCALPLQFRSTPPINT